MKPYEIAFKQFGGQRAMYMIGAKYITHDGDNILSFRFPNSKYANYFKIEYVRGSDLYTLTFGKIRGTTYKVVEVLENITCDQLQEIFEDRTKLYLTL